MSPHAISNGCALGTRKGQSVVTEMFSLLLQAHCAWVLRPPVKTRPMGASQDQRERRRGRWVVAHQQGAQRVHGRKGSVLMTGPGCSPSTTSRSSAAASYAAAPPAAVSGHCSVWPSPGRAAGEIHADGADAAAEDGASRPRGGGRGGRRPETRRARGADPPAGFN